MVPTAADPVTFLPGDCRRLLAVVPHRCVGGLISDPPYGTRVARDGYGRRSLHKGKQHVAGDEDLAALDEMMGEAWKCLRPDAWVALFCSPKRHYEVCKLLADWGLVVQHEVVWDKQMMGLGSGIRYQHELVILGSFGKARGRCPMPSVWRESVPRTALWHPHQKPGGLVCRLIEYATDPGDLVLDPFAGSGTTAICCRTTGRRCLAFEVDVDTYHRALQRLAGGDPDGNPTLFDGEFCDTTT
jgi:site-specific DNA-methyltransferase (adenine-specific)